MWKLIDSEMALQSLQIGHLISGNSSEDGSFEIIEIRNNGVVTAAKTDVPNYMIVFPKKDLVDANWWIKSR